MIIDGRALAKEVLRNAKARAEKLASAPRVLVIVANETAATKSYLAIKKSRAADAGCVLKELRFDPHTATTEGLRTAVLATDADAVIVQLPLPERVDSRVVCDAILVEKDVDVLSTGARMLFEADTSDALIPPVALAVGKILEFGNVDPRGKKAVVVGAGWLVGKPCATYLSHAGADVSHLTLESGHTDMLKEADIIIAGAGSPHFIKPEMLKEAKIAGGGSPDDSFDEPSRGVVLIDAGTTELGGMLAGDADPACAPLCALFTPVPGGVGPLSVACLFENVVTLAEIAHFDLSL